MKKKKLDEIKKEYSNLRKKYSLPEFDKIYYEFEIIDMEKDFILKTILSRIRKKVGNYINLILPPIQPNDSSLHSVIESNIFNKYERNELYRLYRELNYLYHLTILSSLKEEAVMADNINKIWKDWSDLKQKVEKILHKITDGWKKESEEEKVEYYG